MSRMRLSRDAVIRRAAEVADEQGLSHVSIQAIARSFGVRAPSLYNHVSSLDDLHDEVAVAALDALHTTMLGATAGRAGSEALAGAMRAYVDWACAHPGQYDAITPAIARRSPAVTALGARIVDLLVTTFERAGVPRERALLHVRVVRATVHGFVTLHASGGFQMHEIDDDETLDAIIDVLVRGLHLA